MRGQEYFNTGMSSHSYVLGITIMISPCNISFGPIIYILWSPIIST